MTQDNPQAKKGTASPLLLRVAPLSVAALRASWGMVPWTTDRLTPAFSQTFPLANTRDLPPPPVLRSQESSRNVAPPSISSMALVMEIWASRSIFSILTGMDSSRSGATPADSGRSTFSKFLATMSSLVAGTVAMANLLAERVWGGRLVWKLETTGIKQRREIFILVLYQLDCVSWMAGSGFHRCKYCGKIQWIHRGCRASCFGLRKVSQTESLNWKDTCLIHDRRQTRGYG
mmetsp:Transcript_11784/g.32648  ORF Transcript_11784/g.32648 Transcript_11784/m.32648 type:complete len:232 (+) Transcript_11784:709-1404(+)